MEKITPRPVVKSSTTILTPLDGFRELHGTTTTEVGTTDDGRVVLNGDHTGHGWADTMNDMKSLNQFSPEAAEKLAHALIIAAQHARQQQRASADALAAFVADLSR